MSLNKSNFRGYEIENIKGEWFFSKTKKSVKENYLGLSCGYCGKKDTKEGHDGCIGVLDGVMNACCGHGNKDEAYIQFLNHSTIRGKNALTIIVKKGEINETSKEKNIKTEKGGKIHEAKG